MAGILALIGATTGHIEGAVIGLALASLLWLPVSRRWNARAHVCWAATTYVFVVYLAFMAWWTFASHLGIAGDIGGMLLWLLEVVAAFLGCAYLWELCDTLGRASWLRRIGTRVSARASALAREDPTYYGAAWVALGPALLDRTSERACITAGPSRLIVRRSPR